LDGGVVLLRITKGAAFSSDLPEGPNCRKQENPLFETGAFLWYNGLQVVVYDKKING
jgi:hypothetical protein